MTDTRGSKGSIVKGALWMLLLSTLLFWLPVVGALLAGVVGGRKAGGVMAAIAAVFLPGFVMGVAFFFLASILSGMPLIGFMAGMGGLAFSLSHVGPLLLGAILGGLMA